MNDSVQLLYINIYFCFYILIYTSACGEASFDSSCLFYLLHYYDGCQYVKGTKQILIAVCVLLNILVCIQIFLFANYSFIL